MKRKLLTITLALALLALCACSTTGEDDGKLVFGRNIFFARTASDEEAFGSALAQQQADEEDIILEDEAVPMAGLPAEAAEEGWLLVRYAKSADGAVEPVWYRVWTEEGWSRENLPYTGSDWHPVISSTPEAGR